MAPSPRLQLRLASKGTALLRASVNGVPLAIDDTGKGITVQKPLNQWIIPGEVNGFRLDLEWPAGREVVKGLAYVDCSIAMDGEPPLFRYLYPPGVTPDGATPEPPEVEAAKPRRDPPFVESYPFVYSALFQPPIEPPTRLWRDAERLEDLDFQSSRAALEAGRALHAALSARDGPRATALLDYRTRDLAAAYGMDAEAMRADLRTTHEQVLGAPGFNLIPWEEAMMRAQLVADGRIVWITRGYREPPIKTGKMPGFSFGAVLYVARIAGAWTIVR
jgi:hypothetical protein